MFAAVGANVAAAVGATVAAAAADAAAAVASLLLLHLFNNTVQQ